MRADILLRHAYVNLYVFLILRRTSYALQLLQPESLPTGTGHGVQALGAMLHTPLRGMGAASHTHPSVIHIPPNTVGMPLNWHPSASQRLLRVGLDVVGERRWSTRTHAHTSARLWLSGTVPTQRTSVSTLCVCVCSGADEGEDSGLSVAYSEPFSTHQLPTGQEVQILVPMAPLHIASSHALSRQASMLQSVDEQEPMPAHALDTGTADSLYFTPRSAFLSAAAEAQKLLASAAHGQSSASADTEQTEPTAHTAAEASVHSHPVPTDDDSSGHDQGLGGVLSGPCWARILRLGHPSAQPSVDASRPNPLGPTGNQDWIGLVVVVQLVSVSPGCLALELISLGAEPSHLVQNASRLPVAFHENAQRQGAHTMNASVYLDMHKERTCHGKCVLVRAMASLVLVVLCTGVRGRLWGHSAPRPMCGGTWRL